MKRLLLIGGLLAALAVVVVAPGAVEDLTGLDVPEVLSRTNHESEVVAAVNEHRASNDLSQLERDDTLDEMAQAHATESAEKLFGADDTATDLARQFGYTCESEQGLAMDHIAFEIEPGKLSDREMANRVLRELFDSHKYRSYAINQSGHDRIGVGVETIEFQGEHYLHATIILC